MAFPILLNVRYVETIKKEIFMALSSFSIEDSGLLFACEYDDKHEFPWAVTINQVKGGEFGLFTSFSDEQKMKFSEEFSSLLNGFYGLDTTGKVISIKPEELSVVLAEQIFTFAEDKDNKGKVTLIPLGITQEELFETAPKDIPFLKDFPAGYMKPNAAPKAANS
jgi:hypothetical protein